MPIVHFTTVHLRTDTRIRVKQIASLAEALGTEVCLFVQDGLGNEEDSKANVKVIDTGQAPRRRLARMTVGAFRMWRAVRAAQPRVAHFHDPELIPIGLALKLSGIRVIYDVHEDVPRQILGKHWTFPWLKRPMAWAAEAAEWVAARAFDGIVTATPTISKRFPIAKTQTVQNFPILSELIAPDLVPYFERPPHFAYVGRITWSRGAREMVQAIGQIRDEDARLQLAGAFQAATLQVEIEQATAWKKVHFHGWASRSRVASMLGQVRAGLVLFHPAPNHLDAQPNKMFEYMAVGLPVIASDFPLWRQIVEGAGCGLLVDPMDSRAVAEAMQWLLDNPGEAEAMGQRGRQAVEQQYNWAPEADKLVRLYTRLLGGAVTQPSGAINNK